MAGQSDSTSDRTLRLIGTHINNYEVKSLLGEGGMGSVFVAEHPMIGRRVAVKVLKREFAEDRVLVNRFFNEARAANAIRHPNIIEILDVGTLADGLPYLIMPLLEGESLGSRLGRASHLRVGDAVEFAYQSASALAAAHAKGIVHRDLKPDNLFLVPDAETPGRERVKILDFGIAKLCLELSGGAAKTSTGSVMGTPPYMSPEQCMGITAEIDHRTDIYALGIILYEMLCGEPPFVGAGFGEVMMMHMTKAPAPPTSINPGIPVHLERTILKALAKKRDERFTNMAELQSALAAGPARTMLVPSSPAPVAMTVGIGDEADQPGLGAINARLAATTVPPARPAQPLTRPPTTFSSSVGAMEAVDMEEVLPASRSKRWIGIGAGVAAAALVGVFAITRGGNRATTPTASSGVATTAPVTAVAAPAPERAAPPVAAPVEAVIAPVTPEPLKAPEPVKAEVQKSHDTPPLPLSPRAASGSATAHRSPKSTFTVKRTVAKPAAAAVPGLPPTTPSSPPSATPPPKQNKRPLVF